MRISDWSSDVCSSDLRSHRGPLRRGRPGRRQPHGAVGLGLGLRANIPAAFTGGRRLPPTTQGGHLGRPLRVGLGEIGRAWWRERVVWYVWDSVVALSFKKK